MGQIRLNKFIAESGICSRRAADTLIDNKRVKVNGKVQLEKGITVDTDIDIVEVDNKKIEVVTKKIYILLNKPKGYITTVKEQFNRPCVIDLIKENVKVYPIGRLDMDTSGLLLLTNDGDFANSVMHPKNHIYKTYEVVTKKSLTNSDIKKLESGVDIGDYITRPAKVEKEEGNKIRITIGEGKNRQIRRMIEAIDNKVMKLKRISIGNLKLENLKLGEYKYISFNEAKKVFVK